MGSNAPPATRYTPTWSNMLFKTTLLVTLALAASAERPAYGYSAPDSASDSASIEREPLMPFDFSYLVQAEASGEATHGHQSTSDGNQITGQYRVELPDCRTQIVTYTAHPETGFTAEVAYEGDICEPQSASRESYERPQQSYQRPQQTYERPN